jgi:hypothetical protein
MSPGERSRTSEGRVPACRPTVRAAERIKSPVNMVMTVTDTQTGAVKTYTNIQGTAFIRSQDTAAFVCP